MAKSLPCAWTIRAPGNRLVSWKDCPPGSIIYRDWFLPGQTTEGYRRRKGTGGRQDKYGLYPSRIGEDIPDCQSCVRVKEERGLFPPPWGGGNGTLGEFEQEEILLAASQDNQAALDQVGLRKGPVKSCHLLVVQADTALLEHPAGLSLAREHLRGRQDLDQGLVDYLGHRKGSRADIRKDTLQVRGGQPLDRAPEEYVRGSLGDSQAVLAVDHPGHLLGQGLLGLPLLRGRRKGFGEFLDPLIAQESEDLEVADHVGIHGAHEELVEVVVGGLSLVKEDGIPLALSELLPVAVADQGEGQPVDLFSPEPADQVRPGRDISPLVSPADLKRAAVGVIEVEEIVSLEDLVAELRKGHPAVSRLEALLDTLLRKHLGNAEVDADVTQEVNGADILVPVVVVDQDGRILPAVKVEEAGEVFLDSPDILLDLFDGQHLALDRLPRGVADQAGCPADQGDHLVAGALHTGQGHNGDKIPGLETVACGVKPRIDGQGLFKRFFKFG